MRPATRSKDFRLWLMVPLLLPGAVAAAQNQAAAATGAQIYARRCAACHDHPAARVPPRDALTRLSPRRILRTLDFGLMMSVAYPMRREEREALIDEFPAHVLGGDQGSAGTSVKASQPGIGPGHRYGQPLAQVLRELRVIRGGEAQPAAQAVAARCRSERAFSRNVDGIRREAVQRFPDARPGSEG